jgi:hypothetical protein
MNLKPTYRKFYLQRNEDVSGISGKGRIAEGIVFSDGEVVLHWLTVTKSTTVFDNLEALQAVHGHDGRTKIIFDDTVQREKDVALAVERVIDEAVRQLEDLRQEQRRVIEGRRLLMEPESEMSSEEIPDPFRADG